MKKFSKILSVALLVALVLSLGITSAFAAPEDTTISVPSSDSHNYAIYQIFTGELADGVLSNIHYGTNAVLPTGKSVGDPVDKTVLDAIAAIKGTDEEKAEALSAYANLTGNAAYTVNSGASVTVPTGYYLIKDKDAIGANDEATLYIVQVVGPTPIARKAGTTTSDKTVGDINDSTETQATLNLKSSDYDIGDEVPYQLTATLSEKVAQYDKYHVTFEDTLQSGSFSAISALTIKMGGENIVETEDYTVTFTEIEAPSVNGFKYKIEFVAKEGKNLASLNGKTITVDFTATLGEGAKIGAEGNSNEYTLKYSNNPNNNDEGTTTTHKVITFTYKVVVNKVNEKEEPLAGAGFTLYKINKTDAEAAVPAESAKDAATKNAYWAAKAIKTISTTAVAPTDSNVASQFNFPGIDDGYYVLCETTTPAGYNTLEPQLFKVEATHNDDTLKLTALSGTKLEGSTIVFNPTKTQEGEFTGELEATIQNNKGTTLPSTGGIGTTIFYVVGGVLVLAAIILLVTKKRMSD